LLKLDPTLEKKANQQLAVSATSLGVAIFSVTFPILQPLACLGFLYVSASYFKDGYHAIVKQRKVNMAAVDAIMLAGLLAMGQFIAGTLMCTLLWIAQKILLKTEDHSRKNLVNVFGKQPRSVWVLKDGVEIELQFEQLQTGDLLIVNAGEVIPADGIITYGTASIDQHTLTGESQHAEKTVGDAVFATTLLLSGKIHMQVEKAGTDSVAMQISEALLKTADFKTTTRAHWIAQVDKTAPIVLGVGVLALPILGPMSAISLLYSCNYGYSMRVIAPATMMNFLTIASRTGLLIKDGRSLELLDLIDTIIFDKTGTLTLEQPEVGAIHLCADYSTETLLTFAATAEYRQTHPIARAILQAAKERDLPHMSIDNAQYELGYGIKVQLADKTIYVGSRRFMTLSEIAIPSEMTAIQQQCHENAHSLVMVAVDLQLIGAIELQSVVRPEAKQVIDSLRQRNIAMYIISGDHEKPTQRLAQSLGISHYFAETLPEKKAELVAQLQQEGKRVCFIGDGINDSIALKKANVSISMRGAIRLPPIPPKLC
jgi:Cu2+-exporting ATPase